FKLINHKTFSIVNVEDLEQLKAGSEVTVQSLLDNGILTAINGPLKILGNGELTKTLTVKATAVTESAKSKIESAGGSVELV
ncbi:MAG: uL15m family ribosomal protein, partial [Cyanobacteria bacterium P01_G01_bin.4]